MAKSIADITLPTKCPFCGGTAKFVKQKKSPGYMLNHHPTSGIICPARCEIYCDDYEFAEKVWETRVIKCEKV